MCVLCVCVCVCVCVCLFYFTFISMKFFSLVFADGLTQ